ncbi:hypothetical protein [Mesorhizobium sp. dw_380]|uniref:hypothetical protein n=1 Tax=Mesorhizobium sp. dw_380 TaxID=2812001 RepID=UPI001BDF6B19|nr:hypothetical protein [Mesorhizobium sp. dw_380]
MPYRTPTIDDFRHAKWLRRNLRLGEGFDRFVNEMAERVRVRAGRADRIDVVGNLRNALSVIVANLYKSHLNDENRYVIIDRSNDGYPTGPYNPLRINRRAIQDCLDYLSNDLPSYVEQRGGNFDSIAGIGYTTRFRSTIRLVSELEEYNIPEEIQHDIDPAGIIRNTLRDNPQSPLLSYLFRAEPLPSIRLKGEKPARGSALLLNYEPTDDTMRMEANLRTYNRFLFDHHWLDILISNEEFRDLSRLVDDEPDEFGDEDDRRWDLDILWRNTLYRVFNNGRFTDGGRFYGGWWQGVPSRLRRHLTINGYPTAELDYSNMQIVMLYADEGLELEGDAYEIEGIPHAYRKLIKRTVFKIVNADGQIRSAKKAELPVGWTWRQLMDAVREKHRPIAKYFGTGEGIRLQKRDADIAESVMLTMMDEGTLVLPIHDSFVIEDGRQDRLREVMVAAYRRRLGFDINVDANPTWLEQLPAQAIELDRLGVRDLTDWIAELEQRPQYENYRDRKAAFLQARGETWGHEHHFFY